MNVMWYEEYNNWLIRSNDEEHLFYLNKVLFFFVFFAIVTLDIHCLIAEKIKTYGNDQAKNPVTQIKQWQLIISNNVGMRQ